VSDTHSFFPDEIELTVTSYSVAYGRPDATRHEIEEAAKLANCGFIDSLPRGFDTQVGARGAQLSGKSQFVSYTTS